MSLPTESPASKTVRLSWPKWVRRACPLCENHMKFKYADAGKRVHTLAGTINQITNLYACVNPECPMHVRPFNPHPRHDYGARHYGGDVFQLVAEESLCLKARPEQIHARLAKLEVPISLSTVQRICDDVLDLAAFKIDERTREMLAADPLVLMGCDAQDPGEGGRALWVFLDVLKGRVLHTRVVERMDHVDLHGVLEQIRENLEITYVGFVSDKQGLIVKCLHDFYPGIPHQYCQYHFLNNAWKHAEVLDSNVFLPLRKAVNGLSIHVTSKQSTILFEGRGRVPVREAFRPIDEDLQVMLKTRNVTFKQLRGVWLHDKLAEYVRGMEDVASGLDPGAPFTRVLLRTIVALTRALEGTRARCEEARMLFSYFQRIRENLWDVDRSWLEQQVALDEVYGEIWTLARERGLGKDLEDLRTFQPRKETALPAVLGEWCRLWESYRPGLFQYVHFPVPVKTNNGCETAFSKEKQRVYARTAKKQVGHVVETRGEAFLRVTHCTPAELDRDWIPAYAEYVVRQLRLRLRDRIRAKTQFWRRRTRPYDGCARAVAEYYGVPRGGLDAGGGPTK